jgi:heat-inducible transcriptional repressor
MRQRLQSEVHQLHHDITALMAAAVAAGDEAIARKQEGYVISGERNLLHVQDFSTDMNRLRKLFNVFEQKTDLLRLLDAGRSAPGVHIFVGSESGLAELDECSVVSASYASDGQVIGTLAVVGPKRMDYEKVVPIVDITAKLLSNALSQH